MGRIFVARENVALNKISRYSIRGPAYDWVASYLSDRTQCVKLLNGGNLTFSDRVNARFGVPQGSVLGHILFLLFINDLPLFANDCYVTLLDDTSFVVEDVEYEGLCRKAHECACRVSDWCEANGLCLKWL